MNIQNLKSLAEIVERLGVSAAIGKQLFQHACFMPAQFSLKTQLVKGKDLLSCSFFFERRQEEYVCNYYDAALLKHIELPDKTIGAVAIRELDERMAAVNWRYADNGNGGVQDEATWNREIDIEAIVKDLTSLCSNSEGKYFAEFFKLKYWSGDANHPLAKSVAMLRPRFEISQRFYFIEGQAICLEEAYRFLVNRWMEKQQHLERKEKVHRGLLSRHDADSGNTLVRKSSKAVKRKKRYDDGRNGAVSGF